MKIKKYLPSFLMDLSLVSLVYLCGWLYVKLIEKSSVFINGIDPLEFQQMMASSSAEMSEVIANLLRFYLVFAFGLLFLVVIWAIIYAVTRRHLWNSILAEKYHFKKSSYWLLVPPVALLLLVPYLLIATLGKFIVTLLFSILKNQTVTLFFGSVATLFFICLFIFFIVMLEYIFAQKRRVWESIGIVFEQMKSRWKMLGRWFLLFWGLAVGVNLLVLLLSFYVPALSFVAYIGIAVLIGYLSWLRYKLIKEVSVEKKSVVFDG
jgi:hypothetical protein